MADPALEAFEELRRELRKTRESNEELTKATDANTEETAGLREDLANFTEQVAIIAAAVQGMGGVQALFGQLGRLLPHLAAKRT